MDRKELIQNTVRCTCREVADNRCLSINEQDDEFCLSLVFSYMDVALVVMKIEDALDIELKDDWVIENCETIGELIKHVTEQVGDK